MARDEQLPLFVFGTLRVGHSNHRLLRGRYLRVLDAELLGYRRIQPLMIAPSADGCVDGELFFIKPDRYELTLSECDRLEGIPEGQTSGPFYARIEVTVHVSNESHESPDGLRAWAYVMPDRDY